MFLSRKMISWKLFSKLSYVCLSLETLVNEKHFLIKKNFNWFSKKCFPFILGGKHSAEVAKFFLNVILFADYINLILKLFIAIYFIFFQFHPLEFDLILFLYQLWSLFLWLLFVFLLSFSKLKFFIYQIWSSFFWLLFILFGIIYKIIYFFNFIIFQLFFIY